MKFIKILLVILIILLIISAILSILLCIVFANETDASEYNILPSIFGIMGWGTIFLFVILAGISIGYIFVLKHNYYLLESGEGHSYNILLLVGRLFSILIITPFCIVSIFYYKDFAIVDPLLKLLYWFFINFIIFSFFHTIYSITFLSLNSRIKKQIRQENIRMRQEIHDIHNNITPYGHNEYNYRNPYYNDNNRNNRR